MGVGDYLPQQAFSVGDIGLFIYLVSRFIEM